jgi:hypothetical protein
MNPAGVLNEARLLTEDAVAEQFGCSVALLRKWRRVGGGPAFCRVGRLIRYKEADLVAFIEAHRVGAA